MNDYLGISRFDLANITLTYEKARETQDPEMLEHVSELLKSIGLSPNCSRFDLAMRKKEIEADMSRSEI